MDSELRGALLAAQDALMDFRAPPCHWDDDVRGGLHRQLVVISHALGENCLACEHDGMVDQFDLIPWSVFILQNPKDGVTRPIPCPECCEMEPAPTLGMPNHGV